MSKNTEKEIKIHAEKKENYEEPEIRIIKFDAEDIITASDLYEGEIA